MEDPSDGFVETDHRHYDAWMEGQPPDKTYASRWKGVDAAKKRAHSRLGVATSTLSLTICLAHPACAIRQTSRGHRQGRLLYAEALMGRFRTWAWVAELTSIFFRFSSSATHRNLLCWRVVWNDDDVDVRGHFHTLLF